MAVKKKTVRKGYKLPKNVKINQKRSRRASQKKRVRKTSKRGGGKYSVTKEEFGIIVKEINGLDPENPEKILDPSPVVFYENQTNKNNLTGNKFFEFVEEIKKISPLLRALNNVLKYPTKYPGVDVNSIFEIMFELLLQLKVSKLTKIKAGINLNPEKFNELICKIDTQISDELKLEKSLNREIYPAINHRRCFYINKILEETNSIGLSSDYLNQFRCSLIK